MKKNTTSDVFKQGVDNINSIHNSLSNTIGMTTSGWHKAVIGNNFDVIVKESDNDWEILATSMLIDKDHKDRLVMLDVVNQGGKKYMVLTYPARRVMAQELLTKRLEDYKKSIIPFVFGTEEELEIAKEQLMQRVIKTR